MRRSGRCTESRGAPSLILSRVVRKKRASANSSEHVAWDAEDLLFVSNYGEGDRRQITFAHFSQDNQLKVLGWDNLDTALHLDRVADELHRKLAWPDDESDVENWRKTWRSAFTLYHGEEIKTSKALAARLAELARDIRQRILSVLAIEAKDGPVTKVMVAFKGALIHDLDADGFADMYAQTIAYGLLSARIANPERWTGTTRNWTPVGQVTLNPERVPTNISAPMTRQQS